MITTWTPWCHGAYCSLQHFGATLVWAVHILIECAIFAYSAPGRTRTRTIDTTIILTVRDLTDWANEDHIHKEYYMYTIEISYYCFSSHGMRMNPANYLLWQYMDSHSPSQHHDSQNIQKLGPLIHHCSPCCPHSLSNQQALVHWMKPGCHFWQRTGLPGNQLYWMPNKNHIVPVTQTKILAK